MVLGRSTMVTGRSTMVSGRSAMAMEGLVCSRAFQKHGERVPDSFNMANSGMKTTFYTLYMNSKYVQIKMETLIFFAVIKKK